jgi:hypothetical protein
MSDQVHRSRWPIWSRFAFKGRWNDANPGNGIVKSEAAGKSDRGIDETFSFAVRHFAPLAF